MRMAGVLAWNSLNWEQLNKRAMYSRAHPWSWRAWRRTADRRWPPGECSTVPFRISICVWAFKFSNSNWGSNVIPHFEHSKLKIDMKIEMKWSKTKIKLGFANFDVVYYDFGGQARTKISWITTIKILPFAKPSLIFLSGNDTFFWVFNSQSKLQH